MALRQNERNDQTHVSCRRLSQAKVVGQAHDAGTKQIGKQFSQQESMPKDVLQGKCLSQGLEPWSLVKL